MSNKATYEIDSVVSEYAAAGDLQAPENSVIAILGAELATMRMLDIGIGGGRTTLHFAPLVKDYIGFDYAEGMIAACRKRFPDLAQRNALAVCDARAMTVFPDDSFDFLLFSFNGIDYVSVADRLHILAEIARVGRSGAYFLFSTHNLNSDPETSFAASEGDGMRDRVEKPIRRMRFRMLNAGWRSKRERADYMIINDGAHDFALSTVYIKAEAQARQLHAAGFENVRVFGRAGGEMQVADAQRSSDPWLHYLCNVTRKKS